MTSPGLDASPQKVDSGSLLLWGDFGRVVSEKWKLEEEDGWSLIEGCGLLRELRSLLLGGLGYGTGGIHVLRGDKGPATSLGHNPCSATPRHSR